MEVKRLKLLLGVDTLDLKLMSHMKCWVKLWQFRPERDLLSLLIKLWGTNINKVCGPSLGGHSK